MKIAIESSIIGHGHIDPSGKTGIYRYASSFLQEMLPRTEADVFLSLFRLPHSSTLVENFFKDIPVKFLLPNNSLEQNFYKLLLKTRSFRHKYGLMLLIAKILNGLKSKKKIEDMDIFHSLFYPIPNFLHKKHIIKFITIHDIIAVKFPQFFNNNLIQRVHQIIESVNPDKDWIITNSEYTKYDLCTHLNFDENRIFTTHLAASRQIYYPEQNERIISQTLKKFDIPEDNFFLSLATLEPRKNLGFALQCFRKIIKEQHWYDINFVLVGNKGWKIDQLYRDVLNDPDLKNRVIFTGYIPDNYVSALYSRAIAFIYPSLYEGFGLPPLEAMQCGTPVISSNTSSLPEVIGNAGLLVDPENENDMCQAMIHLVKSKTLREKLSQKGLERSTKFSWSKCVDLSIAAYRFAMDSEPR